MKRGVVERDEDVSGVTGTGKVSTFAINDDGRTVVFWPSGHSYFPSLEEAMEVHGHNGKTRFVILDDDEADVKHCGNCHDYKHYNRKSPCHDECPGCIAATSFD